MTTRIVPSAIVFIAIWATSACQAIGLTEPTATPSQTPTASPTVTLTPTLTPTSTPLPTLAEPDLPEGDLSNVYGRVLWQDQPVPDVHVWLRGLSQNSGYYSESTATGDAGEFLFEEVPAGDDYNLDLMLVQQELPPTLEGQLISSPTLNLEVPAGVNLLVGDFNLIASNLMLVSPERLSTLENSRPLLEWEPFPGAAYYVLEVEQAYGNLTNFTVETKETQYQVERPLMACTYGWDVTAYDEQDNPIARSDLELEDRYEFADQYDGLFKIENPDLPWCELAVVSPGPYEDFTGGWTLQLELHPLAESYSLRIQRTHNAQHEIDLEFYHSGPLVFNEQGELISGSLPNIGSGAFLLTVSAWTADDQLIAASREIRFTVNYH